MERAVRLEKWGSPNFFHYYEQIVSDPGRKVGRVEAGEKDGCVYLRQRLRGTEYVLAAKVLGENPEPRVFNSHSCGFALPRSKNHRFTLLTATVVRRDGEAGPEEALSALSRA